MSVGIASRPTTDGSDINYQTSVVQQVIDFMTAQKLNVYRMCFHLGVNITLRNSLIQYYLDHSSQDLIVNYFHDDYQTADNNQKWTQSQAAGLALLQTFPSYQSRMGVEPRNESPTNTATWFTGLQTCINAFKNAGFQNKVVCNRYYTQDWSRFATVIKANPNFYTGTHCYFNTNTLAGFQSSLNAAIAAGIPANRLLNTEVGSDTAEYPAFDQSETTALNAFLKWCFDQEIGNTVWFLHGIRNWTATGGKNYQVQGLTFPFTPAPPPEPKLTFGVFPQTFNAATLAACKPNLLTLLKFLGVSQVTDGNLGLIPMLQDSGIMCNMGVVGPPLSTTTLGTHWLSNAAVKAAIDGRNIAAYKNNPIIHSWSLCDEPLVQEPWQNMFPHTAAVQAVIDRLIYGLDYIKQICPGQKVTMNLTDSGSFIDEIHYKVEHPDIYAGAWVKRSQWIQTFIDHMDILNYSVYVGQSGVTWKQQPALAREVIQDSLNMLVREAKGKPIEIQAGSLCNAAFTQQDQLDYYRMLGEETKARNIVVNAFSLIEPVEWGVFEYSILENGMNKPRLVANQLKSLIGLGEYIPPPPPTYPEWTFNIKTPVGTWTFPTGAGTFQPSP